MHCSHPLTSSQLSNNVMLSRRPLGLQTVNRSGPLFRVSRKQPLSLAQKQCRCSTQQTDAPQAFDTGSGDKVRLPTQGESVVRGSGGSETMLQELPKPPADIDYLAVSPLSFLHRQFIAIKTFSRATPAHFAGAHCSTAKWAKRYWVLRDAEYGFSAPKLDRSTQLCYGAHGMKSYDSAIISTQCLDLLLFACRTTASTLLEQLALMQLSSEVLFGQKSLTC